MNCRGNTEEGIISTAWDPQGLGLRRVNRSLQMEKRKCIPGRGKNLFKRPRGMEGGVHWG